MATLRTQTEILGHKELSQVALYKALAAEFIGSLMLIFAACCASVSEIGIAFGPGITLAAIMQALGHISGGHVNPAVTLSFCLSRKTSVVRGLLYLVVQLLGGIAAAGILYGLVPEYYQSSVGMVMKSRYISDAQAFGVELMITFSFIMAVQGMTDSNKRNLYGAAPLGIGLTLTGNTLFAWWLSGACMNPARALGPMVVGDPTSEVWAYHWIYWAGPLLGSMLATALYQLLFRQPPHVARSESTDQIIHRH